MSAHRPGSALRRWRQLARALLDEWPVIVACWPTVALLLLAGAFHWPEPAVTSTGLLLNTALLFGWGTLAALRAGCRRRSAVARRRGRGDRRRHRRGERGHQVT